MLCETGHPRDIVRFGRTGWWAERKYDGVRATIESGRLYDRRGKDITDRFPEFVGLEQMSGFFDGEIIAEDFARVAGRMHLRDKAKQRLLARLYPCKFVWWTRWVSIPPSQETIEGDREWAEVWAEAPSWIQRAERGHPEEMWRRAEEEGWEGIVVKCRCAYHPGVRQYGWQKIKRFVEEIHRFSKIEETPTGVVLEDEEGHRVAVNGAEAKGMQEEMRAKGEVLAQVQYLPQKGSPAWRFPSYRGRAHEGVAL